MRADRSAPPLRSKFQHGGSLANLADLRRFEQKQQRENRRDAVYSIFSEGLMVALSIILIPLLLMPILLDLPRSILDALDLLNYVIVLFFVLEYVLKLYYSEDRKAYVRDKWHLLDLFIVIASLAALVAGVIPEAGALPILLRLLRLPVAISLGGRTLNRQALFEAEERSKVLKAPLKEVVLDLRNPQEGWVESAEADEPPPCGSPGVWLNLANVAEEDLPRLVSETGLTKVVLEGKIKDWAYPRAEWSKGLATIYLRIPEVSIAAEETQSRQINWQGVLIIDCHGGIVTLSRTDPRMIYSLPEKVRDEGLDIRPATVFYTLMLEALKEVEEFILAAELELIKLEAVPMVKQPRAFLPVTYSAKKEVFYMVSWLVHTREVLEGLMERRLEFQDQGDRDDARIRSLLERCEFLLETGEDVAEGFSDAIDFYLNTNDFQMNRVMKVIAVLTALTIIPTVVGGLLGMNIIGSPWVVSLAEVVTVVGVIMLVIGWVFFRVGWLRS